MPGFAEIAARYLRADAKYRQAFAAARLEHADLTADLRDAQALLDCQQAENERLEAQIAFEGAKIEREDRVLASHDANRSYALAATAEYRRMNADDGLCT